MSVLGPWRDLTGEQYAMMPIHGPWQVSYYNDVLGRRCVLIDDLDEETADKIVARYGDDGHPFYRLPEVRKKLMTDAP